MDQKILKVLLRNLNAENILFQYLILCYLHGSLRGFMRKFCINFYNQSKNMNLKINLIEYAQGQEIPIKILKELVG